MSHRLLIVEDDKDLSDMVVLYAKFKHYDCETDLTGAGCMTKAITFQPHLILLDLNLPQISGLGIIRELKKHPTLADIPIIVFSAMHQTDIVKEAMQLGANAYFTKTGTMEDLFAIVREYVKIAPLHEESMRM